MKRLHWTMYGLYYPAVLGTGVVETLRHASVLISAEIAIALTAGAFFSLSFASAMGLEDSYDFLAFVSDVVEVFAMLVCFAFLSIVERPDAVSPSLWPSRSATDAYAVLIFVVALQLAWRARMKLQWDAYLCLKLILIGLLVRGCFLGNSPSRLHWAITVLFALTAWIYVSRNPYEKGKDYPAWVFKLDRFWRRRSP